MSSLSQRVEIIIDTNNQLKKRKANLEGSLETLSSQMKETYQCSTLEQLKAKSESLQKEYDKSQAELEDLISRLEHRLEIC